MQATEKELQELDLLIRDYINGIPKTKYRLTKKVCHLSKKYGVLETRQVIKLMLMLAALESPGERVQTLLYKYTPSAPYIEKSDSGRSEYTMGWYSDTEQVHSEMLPIQITKNQGMLVDFYGFKNSKEKYLQLFATADKIPYSYCENCDVRSASVCCASIDVIANISIVSIWINAKLHKYQITNPVWAAALYIAFFPLCSVEDVYLRSHPVSCLRIDAHHSITNPSDHYNVRANIKELGFWKAYDWWEGCHGWYKRHHPEWFDEKCWHWGIEAGRDIGSMYDESLWLVL